MRSVESVDEEDLLALGGMGGMNNGVMALRKSTASMSSAMSVSSDQMSTGDPPSSLPNIYPSNLALTSSDQMSTGDPPLLLINIYPHPPADIV